MYVIFDGYRNVMATTGGETIAKIILNALVQNDPSGDFYTESYGDIEEVIEGVVV